jgi:hypothetical protein
MADRTNTIWPQKGEPTLALLTASAGFISALLSASIVYYPIWLHRFSFFPGTVFGALVSVSWAFGGYLHSLWKIVVITAATTFAYYLSFLAAGAVEMHFVQSKDGSISSLALFVGGLTGAVFVLCSMSFLFDSEMPWQRRLLRALRWSPVGAILGILGWVLGPFVGMAVWFVVHALGLTIPTETSQNAHGETSHMYSLWVVWQTGMGGLLGLLLHSGMRRKVERAFRSLAK